jgi:hypothetical protein
MNQKKTPLEAAVREDPHELARRIETVHRSLASEDPHERVDAGRAFRAAAEEDPECLETHLETMVGLLSDDNGSLQLSGALGIAGLAKTTPESAEERVPELVVLLERTRAPAIQMTVIRALSRIGEHSPESVSIADAVIADVLRRATPQIRLAVVTVFASVVIEAPSMFPETVRAMENALNDDSPRVHRCAAATLALVATRDLSAVSSVAGVLARVEELETRLNSQPWHSDDIIEEAANTLRTLEKHGAVYPRS